MESVVKMIEGILIGLVPSVILGVLAFVRRVSMSRRITKYDSELMDLIIQAERKTGLSNHEKRDFVMSSFLSKHTCTSGSKEVVKRRITELVSFVRSMLNR